MSNLSSLIKTRRSTRKYADTSVEKEKIDALLKAALMAPSSKRCTPWEFLVVNDKDDMVALSTSRQMGSAFLSGAPMAIIVMAETEKSNVWVEDASIAASYIQLMAEELGLGSCWVQVRNRMKDETVSTENFIRDRFGIPDTISIECIIAIGYKGEEKSPFDESRLQTGKIHYGKY